MSQRYNFIFLLCCMRFASAADDSSVVDEVAHYQADLARVHETYRNWTEAAQTFTAALAAAGDEDLRWQCREGLARVKTQMGDLQAGLAYASDCARSDDPVRQATGEMILAEHFTTTKQPDLAAERYERIIRQIGIIAYQDSAITQLAQLPRSASDPVLARAWAAIELSATDIPALKIVRACEPDLARRTAAMRPLLITQPGHLDLVAECVSWYLAQQEFDDAETLLVGIKAQYTSADLAPLQARIAAARGDLHGAQAAIERGLIGIEDPYLHHLSMARGLAEVGLWTSSATSARNALARAGDPARRAAAEIELADALVHLQQREESTALLAPLAEQGDWPGIQERAKALMELPALPILPPSAPSL